MSRRFNEQRGNPNWENSSRSRKSSNYDYRGNGPGQEQRFREQQQWRPFENPEPFAQSDYERNEPRNEQRWNEPEYRAQQDYGNPGYRTENRAWNENRWSERGYRTPQDYGDIGYRGDDRARDAHRSYGNPYQREGSYRPYESGYDAPRGSIAREHYQPSAMGNSERYSYRDDADYNRYQQRGNYQGNYGSQQGYGAQESGYQQGGYDWQERGRQEGRFRGVGPRNYQRSDQRITEDINDRLNDHPYIDASDIQVKVSNGEVILEGTVDSRWSKHHVEDLADEVSGVKDVENRIHIKKNIWEKEANNADKQSADSKSRVVEKSAN